MGHAKFAAVSTLCCYITHRKLELFEEKGRERGTSTVLEIDTLVHVFISEILITIYRTWSKLHSKFSDGKFILSIVNRYLLLFV